MTSFQRFLPMSQPFPWRLSPFLDVSEFLISFLVFLVSFLVFPVVLILASIILKPSYVILVSSPANLVPSSVLLSRQYVLHVYCACLLWTCSVWQFPTCRISCRIQTCINPLKSCWDFLSLNSGSYAKSIHLDWSCVCHLSTSCPSWPLNLACLDKILDF
jgi:hypothetical protein